MTKDRKKFIIDKACERRGFLISKKYSKADFKLNKEDVDELQFLDLVLNVLMPNVTEDEIEKLIELRVLAGEVPYFKENQDA